MDFILQRNGYVPATFAGRFPEVASKTLVGMLANRSRPYGKI
jgi:hypothetical protein